MNPLAAAMLIAKAGGVGKQLVGGFKRISDREKKLKTANDKIKQKNIEKRQLAENKVLQDKLKKQKYFKDNSPILVKNNPNVKNIDKAYNAGLINDEQKNKAMKNAQRTMPKVYSERGTKIIEGKRKAKLNREADRQKGLQIIQEKYGFSPKIDNSFGSPNVKKPKNYNQTVKKMFR